MNALKYLNSRLGKTIEQIKKAYLYNKHICFVVCSEPEFIKDLLCSGSFFANSISNELGYPIADIKIVNDKNSFNAKELESLEKPHLYVFNNNQDDTIPMDALTNYVNIATSLKHCNQNVPIENNYLKQSLILVIVKSKPQIPTYIEPYSETITVPFMNESEFKEYISLFLKKTENIKTTVDSQGYELVDNDDYLTRLYRNMLSINATQIKGILFKCKMLLGNIYYEEGQNKYKEKISVLLKIIKHEFEQLIGRTNALTIEEASPAVPAGLNNITNWIEENRAAVNKEQQTIEYMIKPAKGLIVSGIPGTGKSMMAKYIAHALGLRLVRFDVGNVGGQFVGDSEKNMDEALRLIDSLTPCILWIDEIEKVLQGTKNNSHETSQRVFGKFLFWLQERCSCFVFATSNDVSKLPSELFRNGRFDAKYFTFMPTADECCEIFSSTIKWQNDKYNENGNKIQLFDTNVVNANLFKDIIESKDVCLRGYIDNCNCREVNRLNKFLIGSDIAQLIETAKIIYINKYGNEVLENQAAKYESRKFEECIKDAMQKYIKTYGETNLEDIAQCYVQLVANNFNSASDKIVLPFKGYDELKYNIELNKLDKQMNQQSYLYDLKKDELHHYGNLKSPYDKCLYLIIRNVINGLHIRNNKK